MTLVFSGFNLFSIWYTTLPMFVRPHANFLLQIVHFYWQPIEQCHQRIGILSFVFGEVLVSHIRESNGLRTEPCGTPAMGLILSERKPFTLT